MKTLGSKKGFTLIELLAVIVVLAIIMVLASTSVFTYLNSARKSALAVEASTAIESASSLVSMITISEKDGSSYGSAGQYCFNLQELVDEGVYDKDLTDYGGYVVATRSDNTYTYVVSIHNDLYYIDGADASVSSDDAEDYSSSVSVAFDCASAGYRTTTTG